VSESGIEAFRGFFENMPVPSGLAFIVVLDLPIDRMSVLPELLAGWTSMPVLTVSDGIRVEANHVYVPPPSGVVLDFRNGCLHLTGLDPGEPCEFSTIAILFNSLAEALGEDSIGIVLSGTGGDGALGLKAIKEKGGAALVQGSDASAPQHAGMPAAAIAMDAADIIASPDHDLASELRETREQLQSITEIHDAALKELRSANEELHLVNEELQSTSEALETSKGEIRSINQALRTVNSHLASKVDELDRKNSDLRNLFESTQVATIFLDPCLVVRSFTRAMTSVYNLVPSDQGRPLTDIVSRLPYAGLREDCRTVLQTLQPLEKRVVRDDGGTHYLMKIVPYRTPESAVDGTIVTFVDVTTIVNAEQHQRVLVDELNHRVKNMLTVVISMATQTMRRAGTMEEFSKAYMGRIHAMTAAYSLLSSENWHNIPIQALLMEELKPFLATGHDNVILHGPAVLLAPRPALALGMAIHEFMTNAVKYGALSVTEGIVTITWRTQDAGADRTLVLEWVESNGPEVSPPTDRGFGMTLIERGLRQDMSASVQVDFPAEGVRAVLHAPLRADAVQAQTGDG
jgi:two-component system CheB/CheR fusion protein